MNAASGDEHAERFTHLRPLLFTIAYEILGTATESDDVLQESFASAWAGLSRYDPERPFEIWLRRIALVDRLRAFTAARDWGKFHTPKNLAMALAGEAGELLAELQWLSDHEIAVPITEA